MGEMLATVKGWIYATEILQQLDAVNITGLFTNPFFLVPFILLIGYFIYHQEINNLVIVGLLIGWWIFSGTPYMHNLRSPDGGIELGKVLPLVAAGVASLALLVYITFIRSD